MNNQENGIADLLRSQNPDPNHVIGQFIVTFNAAYGNPGADRWCISKEEWQRFEFLGDRVLSLVIAQYLYNRSSEPLHEGEMTKALAGIVSNAALDRFIRENDISIERLIPAAIGEQKTYRERIFGGAFEALVGALYCECGLDDVASFLISLFEPRILVIVPHPNAKGELQEYFQQRGRPSPDYSKICKTGPEHNPQYVCHVILDDGRIFEGAAGRTKRDAEQNAASTALAAVQKAPDAM